MIPSRIPAQGPSGWHPNDWTLGESEATELLLDAAAHELDDWFVFDVRRSRAEEELAGGGQRWTVRAELAGREFDSVAIDRVFARVRERARHSLGCHPDTPRGGRGALGASARHCQCAR
jgi:hypothetical protein